ncbi:hypothetical protein PRZ48_003644 [Zasmidium cellare]|uniref:F-box domain-containing protein n=1 Tax=Zasmidium cellare TaxID=395010 RepID=A0ABR0EWA3_ZASCE|nr:hypothetical protein PRZ48_003644 [Zasmidium cellare]
MPPTSKKQHILVSSARKQTLKRTAFMAGLPKPCTRAVTRLQTKFLKSIFEFLKLPAEIRELIYSLCFSFAKTERFFCECFKYVKAEAEIGNDKPRARIPMTSTPTILLLNRQIFCEAIPFLRKQSFSFHHGIFKTPLLNIFSANVLRQLSSIEITDKGHSLLNKPTLNVTWHGYTKLIKSLAVILSTGHNLKSFTLCLVDPNLVEHVTLCAAGRWSCGFRDQLREAVQSLKIVRNVKKVTFIGIEQAVAKDVKRRMESKKIIGFNDLPQNVLNKIYYHAFDWSSVSTALTTSLVNWDSDSRPFPYPTMTTPTILLLNKTITADTLAIMRTKPVDIVFPTSPAINNGFLLPKSKRFLPHTTLRNITRLNITLESWKWAYNLIIPLSAILRNASIEKLTITTIEGKKHGMIEFPRTANSPFSLPYSYAFHSHISLVRHLVDWGVSGEIDRRFITPLMHILLYNEPGRHRGFEALPQTGLLGKLVWSR